MSIDNLRAGLGDLVSGFQGMKKRKAAKEDAAKEQAARDALSESFSNTLEGQTAKGEMISGGLKGGLLTTEQALGAMPDMTRDRAMMMLYSKAATIQDPDQRRIFMDRVNYLSQQLNDLNEAEAYYKVNGKLKAKFDFEQNKSGMGPQASEGGGGAAQGAPAQGAPAQGGGRPARKPAGNMAPVNNIQRTDASDPTGDQQATIPYSVKLADFSGPMREFLESDPLYSDQDKTPKDGKGPYNQKWTSEEKRAFRQRLNNKMYEMMEKTDLGTPGFEAYRRVFSAKASEVFEQKGMDGFLTTSTRKEGITPQELNITEDVPINILFPYKVQEKGRNKGQPEGKLKLNPEAGKKFTAIPAWARKNMDPGKVAETLNAAPQAPASFYLNPNPKEKKIATDQDQTNATGGF